MDVTKLKLEIYGAAAVLLPGAIMIAELWIALLGYASLGRLTADLKGTQVTVLALAFFVVGNLVQELGHALVLASKGPRYLYSYRDTYWRSSAGAQLRDRIKLESGSSIEDVDAAFEYCLARSSGVVLKREVLLALSDFARSLWVLALAAIWPLCRMFSEAHGYTEKARVGLGGGFLLLVAAWLSWTRMVRFLNLSESPVFNAFLDAPHSCKP